MLLGKSMQNNHVFDSHHRRDLMISPIRCREKNGFGISYQSRDVLKYWIYVFKKKKKNPVLCIPSLYIGICLQYTF